MNREDLENTPEFENAREEIYAQGIASLSNSVLDILFREHLRSLPDDKRVLLLSCLKKDLIEFTEEHIRDFESFVEDVQNSESAPKLSSTDISETRLGFAAGTQELLDTLEQYKNLTPVIPDNN